MPARDLFHEAVKTALLNDGWVITDDPYHIKFGDDDLYIDLAAERTIAAQKGERKIAIEVKSFSGSSLMTDFHLALGQFLNYELALSVSEPLRVLYLAIPEDTYELMLARDLPQASINRFHVRLIVYDPAKEEIVKWIE